jgi:hypothetical protein
VKEETLKLKGLLQEKKMKRMELVTAAKSNISAIKDKLALASVKPLEEVDAKAVHYHAEELLRIHIEHAALLAEIREIEKELE